MLGVRPTYHARRPSQPADRLRLSRAHKQLLLALGAFAFLAALWLLPSLARPSATSRAAAATPANAMEAALPAIFKASAADDSQLQQQQSERLTLVVVWSGITVPPYLGLFLRSVEANLDLVDLLFVAKREEKKGGQCVNLGAVGSNIKVVCLSDLEYWSVHRDYLCARWKCTPEESFEVWQELLHRGSQDYIHSHFRILRGPVFRRYFQDDTRWWGWCDTDVVLGNYRRMLPWAHIRDFDLVQPTHRTPAAEILLYMRGHMTLFNNRASTLDKLHSFPAFRSRKDWINGAMPTSAMEEEDFSTHIFYNAPHITFFAYDAMLTGHFKTMSLSPILTSFNSPAALDPSKGLPSPNAHTLFSPAPAAEGTVTLELGTTAETVWMPKEKVVSFRSLVAGDHVRRFYWRDGEGQVWERCEPLEWYAMESRQEGPVHEALYVHLQMEKREKWFKQLPAEPLAKGHVLTMGGWDYAEVYRSAGDRLERVWRGDREGTTRWR